MRIISGKFKSRKLYYPNDLSIRPTMDRVKETLFNIIGDAVQGKEVLSLFAGSGSLGFEALSRGAKKVVFVDNQKLAIQFLEKNIELFSLSSEEVEVIQGDAFEAIKRFQGRGDFFDFVFIDPPYYQGLIKKTLMNLGGSDILTRFSYLVFEHSKEEPIALSSNFTIFKARKFGGTHLTILEKIEGK